MVGVADDGSAVAECWASYKQAADLLGFPEPSGHTPAQSKVFCNLIHKLLRLLDRHSAEAVSLDQVLSLLVQKHGRIIVLGEPPQGDTGSTSWLIRAANGDRLQDEEALILRLFMQRACQMVSKVSKDHNCYELNLRVHSLLCIILLKEFLVHCNVGERWCLMFATFPWKKVHCPISSQKGLTVSLNPLVDHFDMVHIQVVQCQVLSAEQNFANSAGEVQQQQPWMTLAATNNRRPWQTLTWSRTQLVARKVECTNNWKELESLARDF